jgi:hypothetical protein
MIVARSCLAVIRAFVTAVTIISIIMCCMQTVDSPGQLVLVKNCVYCIACDCACTNGSCKVVSAPVCVCCGVACLRLLLVMHCLSAMSLVTMLRSYLGND